MKVTLNNGFAKVDVSNNRVLEVVYHNGMYDLIIKGYEGKCTAIGTICENKKRLSTINKYAKEYGVQFVA